MLSNAKIGKCHFDKCKALCTHRLNFDGSLPRRARLLLFIGLRMKMLNNDVTKKKIQMSSRTKRPAADYPNFNFFIHLLFYFFSGGKTSRLINARMKQKNKWERRGRSLFLATLLQRLCILIRLVVQCLHELGVGGGGINAK